MLFLKDWFSKVPVPIKVIWPAANLAEGFVGVSKSEKRLASFKKLKDVSKVIFDRGDGSNWDAFSIPWFYITVKSHVIGN